MKSEEKSTTFCRQRKCALDQKIYRFSNVGSVKRRGLPNCKLAAMYFDIFLNLHSMRERKDNFLKNWSGCKRKSA